MSSKNARDNRTQRAAAALAEQKRQERRRQGLIVGGVVVVLLAIVVALFVTLRGSDDTGQATDQVPSGVGTGDGQYGVVVGEEDAPLQMTVYEDFLCPACGSFEAAAKDLIEQGLEEGALQVDYRMVSFLDRASTNDYSSRAMNAALVVLDTTGPEAFHEFHQLLFANQPTEGGDGPDDDQLVEYAVEAGAEESEVRPDIEDKIYDQWIKNATDQMSKDGVNSTPTVVIDGEQVEPSAALQQLAAAIEG